MYDEGSFTTIISLDRKAMIPASLGSVLISDITGRSAPTEAIRTNPWQWEVRTHSVPRWDRIVAFNCSRSCFTFFGWMMQGAASDSGRT